jgi:diacylglycerol kinase (ATP)
MMESWDTCDIEEDQELIEAVEVLVETAAVTIRNSVMNDIQSFLLQCKNIVELLFPVLISYRQDQSLIQQDLQKLLICLLLFVLAFGILAPSLTSSQSQQQQHNARQRQLQNKHNAESANSSGHLSPRGNEHSDHDSGTESSSRGLIMEEESDEERFEKVWSSVAVDKYRLLVLPPSCKLVEKPSRNEVQRDSVLQNRKKRDSDISTTTKVKESAGSGDDDDDPAQRLQSYGQQLLHFLRSILLYNYAGAGWTLILWIRGIQRYRRTSSESDVTVDAEEDGDGDDATSKVSEQSISFPSSPQPSITPSPFATPINAFEVDGEEDLFSTGTIQPKRTSFTASALSPLEEEKKESPTLPDDFPLMLPAAMKREGALSLHHEVSAGSFNNKKEWETSPIRKPILHPRHSPNEKDSLDAYRSAHERTLLEDDAINTTITSNTPNNSASDGLRLPEDDEEEEEEQEDGPPSKGNVIYESAKFFFEAANSNDSLKKMSVEVPVPDKNGYILGDDHLPNSRYTPLLVFVNSRAGPQQGHLLVAQLRRLFNPIQVWDLAGGGPETILESFCVLTRLRILVCGGDGTVSWIISTLEKMNLKRKWPPIAVLPLGTGNDLARIHGWGGGYNNESLIGILEQIAESYISLLDRWEMTIEDSKGKVKEVKSFFNYLGVGADAQAALQVHYLRESRPAWFFSRLVNKAWYGVFGAEDIVKATSVNVRKEITLFADGVEVPLPLDSQGIIVLNIDSYAGGVPLWSHGFKSDVALPRRGGRQGPRRSKSMSDFRLKQSGSMERVDSLDHMDTLLTEEEKFEQVTACEYPSSCQDGVLEVVSIRGAFHLGQIKVGLSTAQKVCQCREAKIVIKKKVAVQIDGEPWRQNTCTLNVKRKPDPAVMLHRSADDGGVETEMSKLLDWAEERKLVDGQVHSVLMKEFSRRIESKTRQRRVRDQDNHIMYSLKRAIGSTGAMSSMQGAQQWPSGISF